MELIDDAIYEIHLRLPPEEPACLVRASLVCKPWRRLLTDPAFLRRYRELHGAPPMLGFLHSFSFNFDRMYARFVPTTGHTSPFPALPNGGSDLWAVDCRHGRVLFYSHEPKGLVVWDPITGDRQRLPVYADRYYYLTAAMLCSAAGCDHLDCHGGPFLVVLVGAYESYENVDLVEGVLRVSVYSSETGEWSSSISIQCRCHVEGRLSRLAGCALYFRLDQGERILKYDMAKHGLSIIRAPDKYEQSEGVLVTTEDGRLGFAGVKDGSMHLWSRQVGPDGGVAQWVRDSVIDLRTLLPFLELAPAFDVVGFAEETGTVFVSTDVGVFAIVLKSGQVRKVGERGPYFAIAPYMSFYTPDGQQSESFQELGFEDFEQQHVGKEDEEEMEYTDEDFF